jgi:parallel beta-helix repeat protein
MLLVVLLALYGCGDSDNDDASTIRVHPGESIQAAVDRAPANATIMVEPGVYHESAEQPSAVIITKNGLRLIGMSSPDAPVVLENAGGQKNGIWVSPADSVNTENTEEGEHPPCGENGALVHGFLLEGFTVRGFAQYGVYLACVDGFTLTRNLAQDDQVYGLFPVRSHHGTLSLNEAEGTSLDAALYVGQSDHVAITDNRAHDNLLGLEIENSSDITATKNELFDNTAGLIADIMPNLQKTDQTNVVIAENNVHDNNRPNTIEMGSTSETPPGTGLVVLGGSMVTVRDNTVANNDFQGIIVSSYCTGLPTACTDLDIDPDPQNVHVVDNQLANNGTNETDPLLSHFAADLFWDHKGQGNCWSGNTPSAKVIVLGGTVLPTCN